ncbi:hypothetical protein WA158_007784 [Blastocystis sp. Blastoise]
MKPTVVATPEEEERFHKELDKTPDIKEKYKREALAKCAAEHLVYLKCIESGKPCIKEQKAFWDCYRDQRGFSKTKFDATMEKMNKRFFPKFHQEQNSVSDENNKS